MEYKTSTDASPEDGVAPSGTALQPAADAVAAAASEEERRFNNLNTRAISLISAGSVVITLTALFGKDLVTAETVPQKGLITLFLVLAIGTLLLAVAALIVGVLVPGGRLAFGDNQVTGNVPPMNDPAQVHEVRWREYRLVLARLLERNKKKAKALRFAYWSYGVAVVFAGAAVATALVADLFQ